MQKPWNMYLFKIMIVSLALALSVGLAWAGSLEPPASAVDEFGNPVPTLRPPTDHGDIRFINLQDGRVVDHRTGLEWEQSPSTAPRNQASSIAYCDGLSLGGHTDWRLPERDELASLVDLDNPDGNPDLPPGHPFSNVVGSLYWSATSLADDPTLAWRVSFANGGVGTGTASFNLRAWCVR